MSNNYSQKAFGLRANLVSELNVRLPSLAKTISFGSASECDLLVGAGTAGSDSVFVRIKPQGITGAVDVLGLAQQAFNPHVAQVVLESNPTGGAGADVGTWATRLAVIGYLVSTGVRVEIYFTANTTAVSASGITGVPTAVDDSLQYPLMATV